MIRRFFRFFFIISLLFTPCFALADGGIFPPPDYYVYETDQQAVIFYENGIETLVLSVTFQGDAENFGWVIPTPTRPEVSKSSDELFTSLDELTRVERAYPMPLGLGIEGIDKNIHIIETKQVEYYDITILRADDPDALAKWLSQNNYQFPEKASYILDSYVNNNWYFTAVKLNTQVREGHLIPLQLKFSTDRIVYPLKISSVMEEMKYTYQHEAAVAPAPEIVHPYYPQKVGILIYVFDAENEQTVPGFTTQYAGWVEKETIEELAFDDNGQPWLKPAQDKYFLTALTRWMSYAEMTHDLYLRDVLDNKKETTQIWFWLVIGISLVSILGIGGIFVYLLRK